MSDRVITAPETEPITLLEAKAQCKIESDDTNFDTLLTIYIAAAREYVESWTNRALITQTRELAVDAFPSGDRGVHIALRAKLISITSIKYDDPDGVEQTMDAADYTIDQYGETGWVFPVYGTDWPSTIDAPNCVRVRYVAGYGAASAVPSGIKAWILTRVETMKLHAGQLVDSRNVQPSYVDRLLDPYVVYGA